MAAEGIVHTVIPPVSVVIVNYNARHFLADCVRAALPQVSEVIVVDNASTDLSLDRCLRHFPEEPKLKLIRNNTNLGLRPPATWRQARKGRSYFFPESRL